MKTAVAVVALVAALSTSVAPPRPISEADEVVAVFVEDDRLIASGDTLTLAAWPDGYVVQSADTRAGLAWCALRSFFRCWADSDDR